MKGFTKVLINRMAAVFLGVALTLTGCTIAPEEEAPQETPTPATATPMPVPKKGGELKVSMRMPKTLNPLLNQDVTVDSVLKLVFEPLMYLDENERPVPGLAESYEISEDGLSVVVKLQDGLQWEDGQPITARDIEFSIDTIKSAEDGTLYKACGKNILSTFIVSGTTIKINYERAFGGAAYLLCFPIIPKHYYGAADGRSPEKSIKPLGSGLYRFDSKENANSFSLVANENYYGDKPYIENVTVMTSSDTQTDLYSFEQGITNAVSVSLLGYAKYKGTRETETTDYVTNSFDFVGFNFGNTYLGDKKIREAIALATPVDKILSEVYLGHAEKAHSPINPKSWVYEQNPGTRSYDPEEAKIKLIEAEAGEFELEILVNEENEERRKIADILSESLGNIGIKTVINTVPFERYMELLTERSFDIFIGGFTLSPVPDITFALHSSQVYAQNYFGYKSDKMDALLMLAANSIAPESFKAALSDIQKLFVEDIPCIGLVFRKAVLLTDKTIHGPKRPLNGNIFKNLNEWFINP